MSALTVLRTQRGPKSLRAFFRSPLALLGAALLLSFMVLALGAPLIAPFGPQESDLLTRLQPPD